MKIRILAAVITTMSLAFSVPNEACTGIKLTARNGQAVHGRTFEFAQKVDNSLVVIPRGYTFTGTTPLGKGLSYQAKYAAVGTVCFENMVAMDGMNEKGLSVGTFYFPGFAGYAPTTRENQARSLSPIDFPNWILTQFASLDEVKSALKNIAIAPTIIKEWGSSPAPFHYIVYDKAGNSIVIEPINGKLHVHDNPIGTLTNSPNFDWHMTNLRNFINLSPNNIPPLNVEGVILTSLGQGSGLVGIPGDFTPPSRFVRATIYSISAVPPSSAKEAVFQAFHILNQFDIPMGASRESANGRTFYDYTLATVVHDPINLRYYIRTFEDQTIKFVDLKAFDLNSKEIKMLPNAGQQTYIDVSRDLQARGSAS